MEHKSAWLSAAFVADFEAFSDQVTNFSCECRERLWDLRKIASSRRDEEVQKLELSVEQLSFLVRQFGPLWPVASHPNDGWNGDRNPWDATNFLRHTPNQFTNKQNQKAIDQLEELIQSGAVGTHLEYAQNALANAKRAYAEAKHSAGSLDEVRNILLSGKPANVRDLQKLFLEEFSLYQARVRTGQTDSYLTFWEGEKPHIENYCRDRLLDGLEERMGAYGVRVHKEGAMANETRVDLLLTCDDFDLPVEIKRQWHPDLWTAACNQLETYSQNYRTDGTGVYLVIWHGYVKGKSIPKPPNSDVPQSARELLEAIPKNLPRKLSSATVPVVLDVSKVKKKSIR